MGTKNTKVISTTGEDIFLSLITIIERKDVKNAKRDLLGKQISQQYKAR